MTCSLPPDAPIPRLSLIRKRSADEEYGFNLHAEKTKGQFIGTVDAGSPADVAGLRPGDRIVAVNGAFVAKETHKEVVRRIKEDPLSCDLVVLDEDGLKWYLDRDIPIPIDQAFIESHSTVNLAKEESESLTAAVSEAIRSTAVEPSETKVVSSSPTTSPRPPSYQEAVNTTTNDSTGSLRPLLCTLIKPDTSAEFGFNLHIDKNKGHFIGKIDANSIAERAGLQEGHRIVGVNDALITPETPHKEIVGLIKSNPLRTELLVVSPEVDEWYKSSGQKYDFSTAEQFVALEPSEHGVVGKGVANLTLSNGYSTNGNDSVSNGNGNEALETKRTVEQPRSQLNNTGQSYSPSITRPQQSLPPVEPYESIKDNSYTQPRNPHQPEWMGLSAAEMRSRVAQRQKADPRSTKQLSLQQKHELIRNM